MKALESLPSKNPCPEYNEGERQRVSDLHTAGRRTTDHGLVARRASGQTRTRNLRPQVQHANSRQQKSLTSRSNHRVGHRGTTSYDPQCGHRTFTRAQCIANQPSTLKRRSAEPSSCARIAERRLELPSHGSASLSG